MLFNLKISKYFVVKTNILNWLKICCCAKYDVFSSILLHVRNLNFNFRLLPIGFIWTIFALTAMYWIDKYNLI